MRIKVLVYTFSVPLIWAAILLLKIIVPDFELSRFFSSSVLVGLLIGSIIGRLFLNSRYLTDLSVDEEKISLTYLTPLARQRQIIIRHSTVTSIELKRKIFLIRDFSSIKFFSKDNEVTFELLDSAAKVASEQLAQEYSIKSNANNT